MSEKVERLRREVRADLQLLWGGQADGNKRIDQMATRIERNSDRIEEQGQKIAEQGQKIAEQGQKIAEQGQKIAEQGHEIAESMRETAKLGREVVALGDQMVGRLKQFDTRFGSFLDAIVEDMENQAPLSRVETLEERVTKLEKRQGPAA